MTISSVFSRLLVVDQPLSQDGLKPIRHRPQVVAGKNNQVSARDRDGPRSTGHLSHPQSASDSSVRTKSCSASLHSRGVSSCRAHLSRKRRRACCRTICLVMPGFEGAGWARVRGGVFMRLGQKANGGRPGRGLPFRNGYNVSSGVVFFHGMPGFIGQTYWRGLGSAPPRTADLPASCSWLSV